MLQARQPAPKRWMRPARSHAFSLPRSSRRPASARGHNPLRRRATPTEVPRRARPWRVFAMGCVLALMLGAGWIAGAKTHEIAQVSSTAWAQVVGLGASLETALARMASWAAPQERTASRGVESSPTTASPESGLDQFAGKLEQIRAASDGAAEESRRSAERLASAMESSSQQLSTRLADLGERLDRIERNAPAAAGS